VIAERAPSSVESSLRGRVDAALEAFMARARAEIEADAPEAVALVVEIARVIGTGGKRLRPSFCYWGHRAAGGADGEAILRAAASLELVHTMALIHDDIMDGATERRGAPSSAVALAASAAPGIDPVTFGRSAAILAGDLASVLADRMLLDSGFAAGRVAEAMARLGRVRTQMAAGQYLDVAGLARDPDAARRAARLKGGVYTILGPLSIGAVLADASDRVQAALNTFGTPLGQAFQLRDDVLDAEGSHGATAGEVNALVQRARAALDRAVLDPEAVAALDSLAGSLELA
jgi:geranylgeranyl diphosphate synthase type I